MTYTPPADGTRARGDDHDDRRRRPDAQRDDDAAGDSGTACDSVGVTQVTWSNDRGGSGTATGTASWSVSGIVLLERRNVLTVTARDAAGNTSTDTLTVTYTPPDTTAPG